VILEITDKAKEKLSNNPSVLQEEFLTKFNKLERWEQNLILSSLQRIASMMKLEEIDQHILTEEVTPGTGVRE
jgi:hypothetical protein